MSSANGFSSQTVLSTTLTVFGLSMPMGYGIGYLNHPQAIIRKWIRESVEKNYGYVMTDHQDVIMWSVVITMFLFGCIIGAMQGGPLANKVGRRRAFWFYYLLCLISCGMFALCKSFQAVEILLASQLLYGISAGFSSTLAPLYMAEIEPKSFQGLAVMNAFGISLGMFLSQIFGMKCILGSANLWPYLSYIPGSATLVCLLLHPYLQESPVYLSLNNADTKHLIDADTKHLLSKDNQIHETKLVSSCQKESNRNNIYKLFKEKSLRKPILLSSLLFINSVFCGVNAIVAFGNIIFTSAGLSEIQSEITSICATGLRLIIGIISIYLTKNCRRRPQLLISILGCIVCLIVLVVCLRFHGSAASYTAILSCATYFVFYAFGIGSLVTTVAAELVPAYSRPAVLSFASSLRWISNIMVGLSFPIVQHIIGEYSLIFFIFQCISSWTLFYLYLPETFLGKSVNDKKESENNKKESENNKDSYLEI